MNTKSLAEFITLKQVNGMTNNMKSITPREMARDLIAEYTKFDSLTKQYTISINDLNDFDIHNLSALIMSSDEAYAFEATGPDNPAYDRKMLPALLRFLKNTTDQDEEIEFVSAWKSGIASYFKQQIEELLEDALIEYNCDKNIWD